MKITQVLLLIGFLTSCGDGGSNQTNASMTFDQFMSKLPDAVCDYYVQCGVMAAAERSGCPQEIYDDVERDFACNGARGVYSQLAASLSQCVDGSQKPCSTTDDLNLFCPNLKYLEEECN